MNDLEMLLEDDVFCEKIINCEDEEQLKKMFTDHGIMNENEELSEGDLDYVSGGASRTWQTIKVLTVTKYEMKKYGAPRTYTKNEREDAIWWAELQGGTLKQSIKDVAKGIKIAIGLYYGI